MHIILNATKAIKKAKPTKTTPPILSSSLLKKRTTQLTNRINQAIRIRIHNIFKSKAHNPTVPTSGLCGSNARHSVSALMLKK
jgi:hypothetical protein